jgi:hypothetical protein
MEELALRFPFSLNVASPNSRPCIQIQLDPRYGDFAARATPQEVLNLVLPVAHPKDLLQGKTWAYLDPERSPMKHLKDLMDIGRLLQAYPEYRDGLPDEIIADLVRANLIEPE